MSYMLIEKSPALQGEVQLNGAKNAVLVIMASLLLTNGKSKLTNVPASDDVYQMITLLESLGTSIFFNAQEHYLEVDTSTVCKWQVSADIMKKMRASVLVMGPLLARFGFANIALPGGCSLGARPIDYHLKNFKKMNVAVEINGESINAQTSGLKSARLILDYPSVGATENALMAATLTPGITSIINAALEPEVLDLIAILKKMGAKIAIDCPATIMIEGVSSLNPIEHEIIPDRLEAGALLLSAAITGGAIYLPQANAYSMDVFLAKLQEMGHHIEIGKNGIGIKLQATDCPQAVSFKTAPYPGFPTDLQAPLAATLCMAQGISVIEETVFENRLLHMKELEKMGARVMVEHNKAIITGVNHLEGTRVQATDIRASCALALAGLVAQGSTLMTGILHWKRGYDGLEKKLNTLGAKLEIFDTDPTSDIMLIKTQVAKEQKTVL